MTGKKVELKWLRPVVPAGAILLLALCGLWLSDAAPAAAVDNTVSTKPLRMLMPTEGEVTIEVVTDPPEQTVAVWVIELSFDPDIVSAESEDCDPINTPAGGVGASGCEIVDTDDDGVVDTAKIFGAVLFTGTEAGLQEPATLADITFEVVGEPSECVDFRLRVNIHADAEGEETGALVQDGYACIAGSGTVAPPGGTEEPTVVPPRTSEPTPEGGVTLPPVDGETPVPETVAPGETQSDGSTFPPDATRPPQTGQPSRTGAGGTGGVEVPTEEGDGGGGTSSIVWVLLGVGVLAVAGGGAWALARTRRSPGPPEA
jgi:hypothetical protein